MCLQPAIAGIATDAAAAAAATAAVVAELSRILHHYLRQ